MMLTMKHRRRSTLHTEQGSNSLGDTQGLERSGIGSGQSLS